MVVTSREFVLIALAVRIFVLALEVRPRLCPEMRFGRGRT